MTTTTATRQNARSATARDNIVQAALTVFALKGYAAATMQDVCMAAGCSKGGLYHHFRTKNAVLRGVVRKLALAGALLPQFQMNEHLPGVSTASLGRVLIDVWAEAARDGDLRALLSNGYASSADAAPPDTGPALTEILRVGALVQMLTQAPDVDADEAARRLGIERAA